MWPLEDYWSTLMDQFVLSTNGVQHSRIVSLRIVAEDRFVRPIT